MGAAGLARAAAAATLGDAPRGGGWPRAAATKAAAAPRGSTFSKRLAVFARLFAGPPKRPGPPGGGAGGGCTGARGDGGA